MGNEACSDTGPILHLHEISKLSLLSIFSKIFVSSHVKGELLKYEVERLPKNVELKSINKDQVALISEKYGLGIAESSAIWMCKSLQISVLLTDDLDAREVAKSLDITPVGTIGIIVRSFRENKIDREEAIRTLKNIHGISSLFVTSSLINDAIDEIRKFKRK